jgi:hypothetical protein
MRWMSREAAWLTPHTISSTACSGSGPGRRGWEGKGWQSGALLYVLTPPV